MLADPCDYTVVVARVFTKLQCLRVWKTTRIHNNVNYDYIWSTAVDCRPEFLFGELYRGTTTRPFPATLQQLLVKVLDTEGDDLRFPTPRGVYLSSITEPLRQREWPCW